MQVGDYVISNGIPDRVGQVVSIFMNYITIQWEDYTQVYDSDKYFSHWFNVGDKVTPITDYVSDPEFHFFFFGRIGEIHRISNVKGVWYIKVLFPANKEQGEEFLACSPDELRKV